MTRRRNLLLAFLVTCCSDGSVAWVHVPFSLSRNTVSTSEVYRLPTRVLLDASRTERTNMKENHTQDASHGADTTLAGDFAIVVSSTGDQAKWTLFRIDQLADEQQFRANGARSLQALISAREARTQPAVVLSCGKARDGVLQIRLVSEANSFDAKLMDVLQRIFVQWVASSTDLVPRGSSCTVLLYQEDSTDIVVDLFSKSDSKALFDGLVDNADEEWVEMVTGTRQSLGQVPRRFVHTFNLLHRGIGLFVTKDKSIDPTKKRFPDLYVHRRSSSKRIFPSLYDMFVGGVSMSGESPELTARREVAEELGLSRALGEEDAVGNALFDCTVCTSYNRCVVTLFSYTMKSREETVTWQEEEVEWGGFIPYEVVVAAADRSIQRLAAKNEWPGSYPAIQSTVTGSMPTEMTFYNADWKQWDFVPDGLLVWGAWLEYIAKAKANTT